MFVPIRSVLLSLLMISVVAAQEPAVTLRGRVIDADTQQLVAARIYIQGTDGTWYFPKSASPAGAPPTGGGFKVLMRAAKAGIMSGVMPWATLAITGFSRRRSRKARN